MLSTLRWLRVSAGAATLPGCTTLAHRARPVALACLALALLASVRSAHAGAAPADSSMRTLRPALHAEAGRIPRADRLEHASLSLTLGLGAGVSSRSATLALGAPLALGLAKEWRDRRHSGFDALDLAADLVGAAAAALVTSGVIR